MPKSKKPFSIDAPVANESKGAEATMIGVQESIGDAIAQGEKAYGALVRAGTECKLWYGEKKKMEADRDWIEGIIISKFPASERAILALPKGGVPEDKKGERKRIKTKVSNYWGLLFNKYAFPEAKGEGEGEGKGEGEGEGEGKGKGGSKSIDERALALVTAALDYLQKNEGFKCDVVKAAAHLAAAKQIIDPQGIDSII